MYIGIVKLIKFASSTRVPSISVEQFLNVAQFLNTTCVAASSGCFLWGSIPATTATIVLVTVIFPLTKIYASEYSQRLDSIDFVYNFIGSWYEYLPFDSLSITFHFFVANFEFLLSEPFSKFTVFCVSIIYMNVTEFCEKFRVVSSDFSMMRNIVVPPVAEI